MSNKVKRKNKGRKAARRPVRKPVNKPEVNMGRRAFIGLSALVTAVAIEEYHFGILRNGVGYLSDYRDKSTLDDIGVAIKGSNYKVLLNNSDSNTPDLVIIVETHTPGIANIDNQNILGKLVDSGDHLLLEGYNDHPMAKDVLVRDINRYVGTNILALFNTDPDSTPLAEANGHRVSEYGYLMDRSGVTVSPLDLKFVHWTIEYIAQSANMWFHRGELESAKEYFELYRKLQEFKEEKVWLPRLEHALETKSDYATLYVVMGHQHIFPFQDRVDWKRKMKKSLDLDGVSYVVIGEEVKQGKKLEIK